MNEIRNSRALSYYCDMTLVQEFQPMGVQLSLKAALPLAERLATTLDRYSKTGPSASAPAAWAYIH